MRPALSQRVINISMVWVNMVGKEQAALVSQFLAQCIQLHILSSREFLDFQPGIFRRVQIWILILSVHVD